ncbi:DUF305 domain-containing protein [Candidatus Roizmanbacteria bacterium]|nr:DUF305 domain-containing protein [Candidatus Roizmanbacteria bacterium]
MTTQTQQSPLLYALIGFLIGGFVVWLIMTTSINGNYSGVMQMMGVRNTGMMGNSYINSSSIDAHFIEQMIPHHEDAITMANLALQNAQRSEVKTLAQNIIDSQSAEITQMKSWYRDWFGLELPAGTQVMRQHGMMGGSSMHMGMMGDNTDITRLETATDFDRAFIEEMIPHHQMAVMMASMLKNGTAREEMGNLADDIIAAQSSEIDQMRAWLRSW